MSWHLLIVFVIGIVTIFTAGALVFFIIAIALVVVVAEAVFIIAACIVRPPTLCWHLLQPPWTSVAPVEHLPALWRAQRPFGFPYSSSWGVLHVCLQALSVLSTLYLSVRLPAGSSCEKSGSQVCVSIQSTKVRDVYDN